MGVLDTLAEGRGPLNWLTRFITAFGLPSLGIGVVLGLATYIVELVLLSDNLREALIAPFVGLALAGFGGFHIWAVFGIAFVIVPLSQIPFLLLEWTGRRWPRRTHGWLSGMLAAALTAGWAFGMPLPWLEPTRDLIPGNWNAASRIAFSIWLGLLAGRWGTKMWRHAFYRKLKNDR
ncbi:hypothetical protein [Sphingomicrobium aestuariivivum]|uniref:hypothetical protein n=1 Tax=Sphingomicrobium aestuariivivum TaxID=1582356 RepID=UPI001FD64C22|nr:hypothetical protein [Sphingomicrobium aestuariivivum]MCJ8190581.1 hypothetical protein [Sphingomicrobium aestuariivivum]